MNITGCVITKDEEINIEKCLNSLKEIASEIIVVDTGSNDNTVQIAKELDTSIYYFDWENDFSKAKNYAISKATGDWIIFLDADEYIDPNCIKGIMNGIFMAKKAKADVILSTLINYDVDINQIQSTMHSLRIFRRDTHIRFFGAIHETIKHATRQLKVLDLSKEITLIHTGYSIQEVQRKQKGQRNLLLLLEEINKNINNHDINFYLSETYNLIKEYELALYYALQAHIKNETELLGTKEKNYLNVIKYLRKLEFPIDQVVRVIKMANNAYPSYPDFIVYLADYKRFNHEADDAIFMYEKAISIINETSQGETQVTALLLPIYKQLSHLYYHTNDNSKTVHTITLLLNAECYDFSLLNSLLKILLNNGEDESNIINFLGKIYKMDVVKDQIFQLKAAIYNGSYTLGNYFMSTLRSYTNELKEEEVELGLLNNNYIAASQDFLSLFQNNQYDQQYLIKAIVSSILSKDEITKNKVFQTTYNSTGIDLKTILAGQKNDDYRQEELELLVDVIKEFCRLSTYDEIDNILQFIKNDNVLLATAELFYQNKNFDLALSFFDEYLQIKSEIEEKQLLDILCKIGNSLYQVGELEIAEKYIENAYSMNQNEYLVYSIWLKIAVSLRNNERIIEIAQKAVVAFPNSNYFISILASLDIYMPVIKDEEDAVRSILYSKTYLQRLEDKAMELTKERKDSEAITIFKFLNGISNEGSKRNAT